MVSQSKPCKGSTANANTFRPLLVVTNSHVHHLESLADTSTTDSSSQVKNANFKTVNLPLLFSHHLHHSYFSPVISLKGVCLLITISFLRQQTKILETTEGRRDEIYRRDHVIGQYHHSLLLIFNSLIFQILRLTALAGGQGHQLLFFSVLFFPQWSQLQPPITFPLAFTVNRNHINRVDYDAVMKFEYKPIWYILDRSSHIDGNPSSESLSLVSDVYVVHTTKSSWLNVGLLDRKTPSHSDLIHKENERGE